MPHSMGRGTARHKPHDSRFLRFAEGVRIIKTNIPPSTDRGPGLTAAPIAGTCTRRLRAGRESPARRARRACVGGFRGVTPNHAASLTQLFRVGAEQAGAR
jgi:alkanesulfonate monooxygenase SsuD/methylene tetrahydromethanopterin reductase-like flavin-dependent oxidoreductase (luciferase family)